MEEGGEELSIIQYLATQYAPSRVSSLNTSPDGFIYGTINRVEKLRTFSRNGEIPRSFLKGRAVGDVVVRTFGSDDGK